MLSVYLLKLLVKVTFDAVNRSSSHVQAATQLQCTVVSQKYFQLLFELSVNYNYRCLSAVTEPVVIM